LDRRLSQCRTRDYTVGLVPTMGALHDGHLSLIEKARAQADIVVVSIFVNPVQFTQAEDYGRYPRTLEADTRMCAAVGADVIFAPDVQEMYPSPLVTFVDVTSTAEHLCGRFRPGHFRGVATVVMKLFQIVRPGFAYFGEKDIQQLAVIRRMVRDLNVPVTIVPVRTVREPDGLAMSSRNQRLSPAERPIAPALYKALCLALSDIREGTTRQGRASAGTVLRNAREYLATQPQIDVEYLELVDPEEMQPLANVEGPAIIAIAAWLGGVRLIDNVLFSPAVASQEITSSESSA
jgi:pantoate--beta-alanine ligase